MALRGKVSLRNTVIEHLSMTYHLKYKDQLFCSIFILLMNISLKHTRLESGGRGRRNNVKIVQIIKVKNS